MRRPSRLPNADIAVIDERKITRYLLASDHPAGRAKAVVFQRFGFGSADWRALRDALLVHARAARVVTVSDTEFGAKYVIEGELLAPDGRRLRLRAVWFVDTGETAPRLITAYAVPGANK
jgi:hypothetical protein